MNDSDRKYIFEMILLLTEASRRQSQINADVLRSLEDIQQRPNYSMIFLVLVTFALSCTTLIFVILTHRNQPCDANIPTMPVSTPSTASSAISLFHFLDSSRSFSFFSAASCRASLVFCKSSFCSRWSSIDSCRSLSRLACVSAIDLAILSSPTIFPMGGSSISRWSISLPSSSCSKCCWGRFFINDECKFAISSTCRVWSTSPELRVRFPPLPMKE